MLSVLDATITVVGNFAGLKSLSQDELGVYLQLTEELNKERQSLDGLSQTASDTGYTFSRPLQN
jgi:hypothetical protein